MTRRGDSGPLGGFRAFVLKGNAIDLAIGVVVGAAFTAVVKALVDNIITPVISLPGTLKLDNLSVCIKHVRRTSGPACIGLGYGAVVSAFITFLVTAAGVYFLFVRPLTRLREGRKGAPKEKHCPECLTDIPIAAIRCRACGIAIPVP